MSIWGIIVVLVNFKGNRHRQVRVLCSGTKGGGGVLVRPPDSPIAQPSTLISITKTCLPPKHIYNSIEKREITKWGLSDFDTVKDFLYNVCEK